MLIKTNYFFKAVLLSILLASCASIQVAPPTLPAIVDKAATTTQYALPSATATETVGQACETIPENSISLSHWLIVSKMYTSGEYKIIDPASLTTADAYKKTQIQISPDNSSLIYSNFENNVWNLYYVNADGENMVKSFDQLAYTWWLSKDTIALNKDFQFNQLTLLNLTSGVTKNIKTDFPDFHPYAQELLGIWGHIPAIDPSLEYAVYPTREGINMIKLSTREVIFKTQTSPYTSVPIWSPTGDSFIMTISTNRNKLLRVYLDGHTEGVDGLKNTGIQISSYTWSHDGRKIAFWLADDASSKDTRRLAISDLINRNTITTCISSFGQSSGFYDVPVWSPDGRFIATSTINTTTETREVHLLDVITGGDFQIQSIDDYVPLDWLTFAPNNK